MHDMFRLWCLGEEDLLSETAAYKLTDTGQGKQRVQQSPRTFKAMQVKFPVVQSLEQMKAHAVLQQAPFSRKRLWLARSRETYHT